MLSESMDVPTILITGINGFVGLALCAKMQEENRLVRGTVRSGKHTSILPVGVKLVQVESIGPDTNWSDALDGVNMTVHLAARVHVMKDTSVDPLSAFREVNVAGAEHLARMASQAGVRRFIYVSSVKVNGEGSKVAYSEDDEPLPVDPYGISKWEAEMVLHKVAAKTGMEVVILRPPLVYGPSVKANFLRLLKLTKMGIPLPLASLKNQRSMIYVGNLVDAIMTCLEHPKAVGETFMVSDSEDVSTSDLIRMIAKAMGKKARLIPFPLPLLKAVGQLFGKSPEIERLTGSLCIDSSKIREVLGWKPPYTMEESIRETVKWYQNSSRSMMC
ncbi:MAG TPA: SDR family oxidoreductase [Thermodesulfovibrionia bacterium]|nr:SDR family oxidoreductase [Thermodesulfovibrionia bacterium]